MRLFLGVVIIFNLCDWNFNSKSLALIILTHVPGAHRWFKILLTRQVAINSPQDANLAKTPPGLNAQISKGVIPGRRN